MFESIPSERPFLTRWFADAAPFLKARWIWLRALGAIFFSAFYSLWFQIHGLIGPNRILPAGAGLEAVRNALRLRGYWLAPTLLWVSAGDAMLTAIVVIGLIASVTLTLN